MDGCFCKQLSAWSTGLRETPQPNESAPTFARTVPIECNSTKCCVIPPESSVLRGHHYHSFFNVLLTVHLSVILVINQLNTVLSQTVHRTATYRVHFFTTVGYNYVYIGVLISPKPDPERKQVTATKT